MNALYKMRVKATLKYTWPIYIVSAIIIGLLMTFIFKVTHKEPGYKNITIFISGLVNDDKKMRDDLLSKYSDKDLKTISYIEADPSGYNYYQKLTVPGYNSADILIIHASYLENFKISTGAIELSEEMIATYYQGYTFYQEDTVKHGIKLDKEKVKDYMYLPDEDCYMFLNANSENIGKYSKKNDAVHDVALNIVKDWGM